MCKKCILSIVSVLALASFAGLAQGQSVHINFQPADSNVPEGYLPDSGQEFGDQGNGYSYGWDSIVDETRDRGGNDDQRYDTVNHLQKADPPAVWEIELANGVYDVFMVCGDPGYTDQINTMNVEGVVLEDLDGEDNYDEYALTVAVTDGRLTITADAEAGADNAKICFVDIARATAPEAWAVAAAQDAPGYLATDVADGLYDIGEFGGEMTYEFIVQSNPLEEQASMCLIGRRDIGDTQSGLKYEQWNNTGTYGATTFGVADYDYGVATNPGVPTHLVFVASEAAGTTALYVDGAYQGSVDAAILLSGAVGIGYGAQDREGADPFFDDFDGEIFGVAIYDGALTAGQIKLHANAYLMSGPADITAAGDAVQGVPNDGDWPGAETPDLAIDDDVNTKYLHFKGETEPTGFQVTPMLGSTLVTGLTLTTANDAIERDPIQFELYGSNESIDGPYELIAAGEVADFNDVDAWPRFTMNATAITFENTVAYEHYQILFPAVRDPASANSMQIAEVELIGVPTANLVFAEDFEGLPLGPNVDESLAGDAVWTKTAPEGWTIDDSGIPGVGDPALDGVTEWAGWSFADKAWWTEAAEDQDRSLFTLGSGTVAVADPDEWDDTAHADGYYHSFLSTPIIDLAGVEAGTVLLQFASSWRPEFDDDYHQTGNITVSFDGGDPVEVLLWESDENSANYKPYATNEAVGVAITVPEGAQNMVVTFGLYDAGNDWWWAIDNVEVVYY